MNLVEFAYLIVSISFSVGGQLCLKLGATKLTEISASNIFERILAIFLIPELILGLACYALGAIAYILLLTKVDLSMAAPAVSLVYVFSVLLGFFLFKEIIPVTRTVGLGFVTLGVVLITLK
jgi:drug/metabolite transporter (DMT)-like permease